MEYLFEVIHKFWGFFFGGVEYADVLSENLLNIIDLLAVTTTIALVVNLIVKPLFSMFPFNKN